MPGKMEIEDNNSLSFLLRDSELLINSLIMFVLLKDLFLY